MKRVVAIAILLTVAIIGCEPAAKKDAAPSPTTMSAPAASEIIDEDNKGGTKEAAEIDEDNKGGPKAK